MNERDADKEAGAYETVGQETGQETGHDTDKQRLLDLLVDGELSDDERRELLAWCEREPQGWRRCACAFLEAQNWSQVLGDLADSDLKDSDLKDSDLKDSDRADGWPGVSGPVERPRVLLDATIGQFRRPHSSGQVRQWGTMLAMAASIALAFSLGLWMRDAAKTGRFAPDQRPLFNTVEDQHAPSRVRSGRSEQGPSEAVQVVGGLPGAADEIQWPEAAGNGDGQWLLAQPDAVPDDVRQALERLGHQVDQRRQLVPYRLDDGRRVIVPVDQVEVRPVKNRAYQ